MDSMGDGDELEYDDDLPPDREPFLTPESRAFIAAGLVLASLLGTSLFQFFSFWVLNEGGDPDRWRPYVAYAGPSGVLAAAGAILGWPVRDAATSPAMRGLAAAAVVVGALVAVGVLAGLIAVATKGSEPVF
jgi:hypothetical protein